MNEWMDEWMNESIKCNYLKWFALKTVSFSLHSLHVLASFFCSEELPVWKVCFEATQGRLASQRRHDAHFGNLPQITSKSKKRFDLYSLDVFGSITIFFLKCINCCIFLGTETISCDIRVFSMKKITTSSNEQVDPEEALEELRESLKALKWTGPSVGLGYTPED